MVRLPLQIDSSYLGTFYRLTASREQRELTHELDCKKGLNFRFYQTFFCAFMTGGSLCQLFFCYKKTYQLFNSCFAPSTRPTLTTYLSWLPLLYCNRFLLLLLSCFSHDWGCFGFVSFATSNGLRKTGFF